MNRDDTPISGFEQMPTPPPRPGFWDDLHDLLVAQTDDDIAAPAVAWDVDGPRPGRNHRGRLLLVAAALLVLVVGLAALTRWRADPPAPADQPDLPVVTITDPTAIDLDAWASNPPSTAPGPFRVFDVSRLPAAWRVETPAAGYHNAGDPDPSHFSWHAGVRTASGQLISLSVSSPPQPHSTGGDPVTVHDQDAVASDQSVRWIDPRGVGFEVGSADTTAEELTAVAEELDVVEIDALPTQDSSRPGGDRIRGSTRLAGRINGHAWSVTSAEDATTDLFLNLDGSRVSGLTADTPHDVSGTWEPNLSGEGTTGTMIFGLTPPNVESVRLRLATTFIDLPVIHDDAGTAVFAIPVPPGLRIEQIDLVTNDGDIINRVTPPTFLVPSNGMTGFGPIAFDGTFPTVGEPDPAPSDAPTSNSVASPSTTAG